MPARLSGSGVRTIEVGLEYSTVAKDVSIAEDGTVGDLRLALAEAFGVPPTVTLLQGPRASCPGSAAEAVRGGDDIRPPATVVLKGVAALDRSRPWAHVSEEDMLLAAGELNQLYGTAGFQEQVRIWQSGSGEAPSRVQTFRAAINATRAEVLPRYGFEARGNGGFPEWERAVAEFQRFPAFADLCRKNKVLLGMLSPEQARASWRTSSGMNAPGPEAAAGCWTARGLQVEGIAAEEALTSRRLDCDEVCALLHRRIYEENRDSLWRGGSVPGHEMPSFDVAYRKYMEPPGATLLRCLGRVGAPDGDGGLPQGGLRLVGGAALFPVAVRCPPSAACRLDFGRGFCRGGGAAEAADSRGQFCPEPCGPTGAAADVDDDDPAVPTVHVGYVNALAAEPGSGAGSALLERIEDAARSDRWQALALHSITVPQTLAFWPRRGFRAFGGPDGDERFRFACLQGAGVIAERECFEQQLPHRPGCVLFVKFLCPAPAD